MLALTVCFYGYVFVNFQKELAGNKRKKISGAVTIPLHVQHCQENEPEQSSRSSEEVYQVESPYLGPLFLVPRGNENVTHELPEQRMRGSFLQCMPQPLAPFCRETADNCSPVDSDHGNVIQITASASGSKLGCAMHAPYESLMFALCLPDPEAVGCQEGGLLNTGLHQPEASRR